MDIHVLIFFFITLSLTYSITNTLQQKINELQIKLQETTISKSIPMKQQIPFRDYINPKVEMTNEYFQIGFIYNSNERYPLYGRHLYPGRSDRWEYYIIDESRNKLRIPFQTRNNIELYSGDEIQIKQLNNILFTVEIYDYDKPKYNPNII